MYVGKLPKEYETTPEILSVVEEIARADKEFNEFMKLYMNAQRSSRDRYVSLVLEQRPSYPTHDQQRGIELIAAMIRRGEVYGDHLGHASIGEENHELTKLVGINYSSIPKRINFHARAPYIPDSAGVRMWEVEPSEIEKFRELIHNQGLSVLDEWQHDDGYGFIVAYTSA